ncbi:HAD family hydrolase [Candidatus Bathyarchaeota archaeon]|nr:HAD family hydrolase [Candidatus Bathyarchaeota archaeon]
MDDSRTAGRLPRVILLDLDGTLVEFCIDYLAARREALRLLEDRGYLKELKLTLRDSIFHMDREVERLIKSRGEAAEGYDEIHVRLMAIVERYESEAAERTRLLPNVRETLEELKRMGMRLVLFTADGDEAMNTVVEKTGIGHLFDRLVSRGSSVEVKPHPRHIIQATADSEARLGEIMVVGDSVADIVSGRHVGAVTVGVTTGLNSGRELLDAGADYLIDSIAELPSLLRALRTEPSLESTREQG